MGRVARQEGHPGRKKPLLQKPYEMLSDETALSPWQPLNGQRVLRISRLNARADEVRAGELVNVCTVNVGTLRGRSREVADMLSRRKIDICCVQEVRYKNEGCSVIGDGEQKFKFWYKGNSEGTNGVGIMMKHDLAESVIEVRRYSDRLMSIKAVFGGSVWHFFSLYAPQVGRPAAEKQDFWEKAEDEIGRVPNNDGLIIGGDMNAHVGRDTGGYEDVLGLYGYGERNAEGTNLLDICKNQRLRILNTYFKKEQEKRITYKAGGNATQLDLLLMRLKPGATAQDCAAIPGEPFLTQHRVVRAKILIKGYTRKKKSLKKKLKTWKLKNEESRSRFEEVFAQRLSGVTSSWSNIQKEMISAAEEVCGRTSGRRGRERETWWWNESLQQVITEKKEAYRRWQSTESAEDKRAYQIKSREAKRSVAAAKKESWIQWSSNLNTAEGRNKMFRVAAQMKKDKSDILGSNFIKNESGGIEVREEKVQEVWKSYFQKLLNEENENEIEEIAKVAGPIESITLKEVETAIKSMKSDKAPGPSGVTADLFKCAGRTGVVALHETFEKILRDGKCPAEWSESLTVTIYKGKGDPLECGKHRGLRLLEHGMKVFEKVLDSRLRKLVNIDDCQFGFMPGKSCTDAIFILRRLQEKYIEKKKKLYHIFVDLEKAFDRVPRRAIEWALRRQHVPEQLIQLVMCLYAGSRSKVCAAGGTSEWFDIGVGVHQGSTLSPLLFVLILEEVSRDIRKGGVGEMLYADDLVLTADSRQEVEGMMVQWKEAMERRGLKVNIGKTKMMVSGGEDSDPVQLGRYPCAACGKGVGVNSIICTECGKWCHFRCSGLRTLNIDYAFVCPRCTNGPGHNGELPLQLGGEQVEVVNHFCYLGDVLSGEGGVERAIKSRTAAAWRKWRDISGLLTNKSVPLTNRGGVYSSCVRSVLLYGAETWSLTKKQEEHIQACDRRMLRYMAGVSLSDRVPSYEVARRCGVRPVVSVIRENRLRWFGHVKRRRGEGLLGEVMEMEAPGRRPPGRPKKTWIKNVEEDLTEWNLNKEDVFDREKWRALIKRQTR